MSAPNLVEEIENLKKQLLTKLDEKEKELKEKASQLEEREKQWGIVASKLEKTVFPSKIKLDVGKLFVLLFFKLTSFGRILIIC